MTDNQGRDWTGLDQRAADEGEAIKKMGGYRVRTTCKKNAQDSKNRLLNLDKLMAETL